LPHKSEFPGRGDILVPEDVIGGTRAHGFTWKVRPQGLGKCGECAVGEGIIVILLILYLLLGQVLPILFRERRELFI